VSIKPWSFSRIKSFEQCPKKFYHLKVAKDYKEPVTSAMHYGTQAHLAAEEYVKDGKPLPEHFSFLKDTLDSLIAKEGKKLCEYEMGITESLEPCGFRDKDVWYRGIADLVIINEDKKLAWIVDYKTSKSATYADRGQLELMALAVFKHFPKIEKVNAGLLFVVCKQLITEKYTRAEEGILWGKWLADYHHMEDAVINDVWNAHPSGLCKRHCPITECLHNGSH
jgi:hypothetical protein